MSRPAGIRYPHVTTAAKDADHRFCPLLDAVRLRAEAGREQWGQLHDMPSRLAKAEAADAVKGLYRARNHTGRRRDPCGPLPLSVQAGAAEQDDGTWRVWFRVWDRRLAKAEIARRVAAGERLAYNPLRDQIRGE